MTNPHPKAVPAFLSQEGNVRPLFALTKEALKQQKYMECANNENDEQMECYPSYFIVSDCQCQQRHGKTR